jgi:hypothetical protein
MWYALHDQHAYMYHYTAAEKLGAGILAGRRALIHEAPGRAPPAPGGWEHRQRGFPGKGGHPKRPVS